MSRAAVVGRLRKHWPSGVAALAKDPKLAAPEHQGLVKALEERWEGRLSLARVG
ncbi:hypothetical protein [Archangium sp.]|uniref:hypothetical protein n=1 Tax=Archangium sp. TaxID=1872627 RepID=UPI002D4F6180|nr:hypothetical protein [Archangium sp.]HYO58154.1 hypothetical protein [Archangium sp.]